MGNGQVKRASQDTARRISAILTIIAALALVIGLFLPYVASTGETRAQRLAHPDVYSETAAMTNGDAVDISLVEYARAYWHMGTSDAASSQYQTTGMFYFALIVALFVLVALTLALAVAGKPAGSLAFSLLALGMLLLLSWDFESRRIIGVDAAWGFAHTLLFAAAGAAALGSLWAIVARGRGARRAAAGKE